MVTDLLSLKLAFRALSDNPDGDSSEEEIADDDDLNDDDDVDGEDDEDFEDAGFGIEEEGGSEGTE